MDKYSNPNYGANAAMGRAEPACETGAHPRTMVGSTRNTLDARVRPTVGAVADLSNELHSRLSMLEESLRTVHQRIGAEHGPEAGAEAPISDSGPVDFTFSQIADAIRRIDNFRTIVETINSRI